jgi:hypothetical protein
VSVLCVVVCGCGSNSKCSFPHGADREKSNLFYDRFPVFSLISRLSVYWGNEKLPSLYCKEVFKSLLLSIQHYPKN